MASAEILEDPEVTKRKFSTKWKREQIALRERLETTDRLGFEVPQGTSIRRIILNDEEKVERVQRLRANPLQELYTPDNPLLIGGVDISCSADRVHAVAGLVVCAYPTMEIVYKKMIRCKLTKPYIAGFLAFREVEHLENVLKKAKREAPDKFPQVILVDGNGVLHYRRFGLASHLGVVADVPTIGVAKKLLNVGGLHEEELVAFANKHVQKVRDCIDLYTRDNECVGTAMRTVFRPQRGKPAYIYISIGHRISLESALKICSSCLTEDGREPFPVYEADRLSRQAVRAYDNERGALPSEFGRRGHIRIPREKRAVTSDNRRGRGRGRGRGRRGGRGHNRGRRGRGRGRGVQRF